MAVKVKQPSQQLLEYAKALIDYAEGRRKELPQSRRFAAADVAAALKALGRDPREIAEKAKARKRRERWEALLDELERTVRERVLPRKPGPDRLELRVKLNGREKRFRMHRYHFSSHSYIALDEEAGYHPVSIVSFDEPAPAPWSWARQRGNYVRSSISNLLRDAALYLGADPYEIERLLPYTVEDAEIAVL